MVMLCCVVSLQVMAQSELTVADGTSTSSNVPAYGLYADTQNARSQCLYPADSLTDMNGGSISQMTFYLSSPAAEAWTGTFQVRIGETDATSLSSGWIEDDLTVVYTGAMDASGTTLTVVFDDAYTYNGGNLVFDWLVTTAGNWKSASFYCASLTGASRYRSSGTAAGSVVAYLPKCTFEYTPGGGSVTVCGKPESLLTTDLTAHEATLNWAGGSETYNVEYKKTSDDEWSVAVRNTTSTSIVLTELDANTAYQARVQSVCGEETSGWRTASFKTLIGIPYLVDFDALTALPSEWTRHSGKLSDVLAGTASLTSTTSGWTFTSSTTGVFESKHMYCSFYGSSVKYWFVSPSIPMDENVQLSFAMALSKTTTSYSPITPGNQSDDKFVVLASVDDGATWSILRQWDNAGSEYVYDNIATEGEEVTIDLSDYSTQTIKLAFYSESTAGTQYSYLHIDDILVGYVPSCLKPTNLAEVAGSASKNSIQLTWTANSGETNWKLQYKKDTAKVWSEPLDVTAVPFTLTGLDEFTLYDVRVAAFCDPMDESTLTDYCRPIKVKTASGVPFKEGFSATALPSDWKRYSGLWSEVQSGGELTSVSDGWNVIAKASANNIFPDSARHLMLNIAGDACKYWIVSPMIEMEAGYQLTFDLALTKKNGGPVTGGEQNDDVFAVLIYNGTEWDELGIWSSTGSGFAYDQILASEEGQVAKFDLSAYAGQNIQIAFYGESTEINGDNNLHISNVQIDLIPACSPASSLTVGDIEAYSANVIWTGDEGGLWQYGYVMEAAEDFVPTDADFTNSTEGLIAELTGLAENTEYLFFLRHVCEGGNSEIQYRRFVTKLLPAAIPYSTDFEDKSGWNFINGDLTNKWAYGTAAHTGASGHALYISDNNGASHSYTITQSAVVYAVKPFLFEQKGTYIFSYDWLCNGEGTSTLWDYLRVALVPADVELEAGTTLPTGVTYNSLPEGVIALDGGLALNSVTAWQSKSVEVAVNTIGVHKVVLLWRNDSGGGTNPPAAVDNFRITRMSCPKPNGLVVSELDAQRVVLEWMEDDESEWQYACVLDTVTAPADDDFLPINTNTIELTELTAETSYKFYLRKVCGESFGESLMLPFKTTAIPALLPFEDGFEGENTWNLVNGDLTNKWAVGTAVNNGGTHALYISNDNGASYAYSHSGAMVYAAKLFRFDQATYSISYDWMANGESTWDYLRVALVPASVELTAGTTVPSGYSATALPTDWIALDGGSKLNLATAWQSNKLQLDIATPGNYYVVFGWKNDGTGGTNPPAAIDNISIRKLLCTTPANLQVDSIVADSALLRWEPQGEETTWLVRYRKSGAAEWNTLEPLAVDTVWLTGLDFSSIYEAQVAGWCDTTDVETISDFSASVSFRTECIAVASLNVDFETISDLLCWSVIQEGGAYPDVFADADKASSGTNFIYYLSSVSGTPTDQYVVLPELISLEGMRIKFQARKEDDTDEDLSIGIGVMTDPTDVTTFELVASKPLNSTSYAPFVVPFTDYTGEGKHIAIKMPAATTGYATLIIDDVVVEAIPNCIDPADLHADSITPTSALLKWNPQGEETAWLIRYRISGAEEWADTILTTNDSLLIENLAKATSYEVQIAAWCDPTDEEAVSPFSGSYIFATGCGEWSIINDGIYTEGFESYEGAAYNSAYGVAPRCWDVAATNTYGVNPHVITPGDTYAYIHTGEKALTFYGSGYCYAVLPEFAEPLNTLQISFWAAMESATYGTLKLGYITNETGIFHEIATYDRTTAKVMAPYETSLLNVPDSAARLVFEWYYSNQWSCCIDDIEVSLIPTCLKPTDLEAVLTPANGSVATLKWKPGKEETAWAVEYSLNADMSDSIYVEASDTILAISGLLSDSTYYARVKAICSESDESAWSYTISFTPTDALIINDSTTSNMYMPFYTYYVNYATYGQFIVPAAELAPIVWDSISQLTFYTSSSYPTSAMTGAEFDVYMAPADSTTLSAIKNWEDLDKVVNRAHLSVADHQMVVTLDEPYQYAGGNLLIGFNLATPASSTSTTVYWLGKSNQTGASMSGYNSSASYSYGPTQRNFLPKMKIAHIPGEEPTCYKVNNIAVSSITANSAVISWTNGADEEAWQMVYSLDENVNLAEATPVEVASNPYALSGLESDTTYYVYVRANCGDGDYSVWSKVFTFHTASACQTPDDLAAADIAATSATISWNDYGQTGFNLRYSTDGTNWLDTIENVASPYLLAELEDGITYYVQVQVACEDTVWSESLNFQTIQLPATAPFFDDFENGNRWLFINGTLENAWAYGTATNNGGTHSLYISNDGGTNYSYTNNKAVVVFATKLFSFETGNYMFQYDWLCNGESTWDYLRVALVPDSVELTAGTSLPTGVTTSALPANWIALDGGSKKNLQSTWQTFMSDAVAIPEGQYKVVLLWRDDTSGGATPPAAVDNFRVTKLTCMRPNTLVASNVYAHSAMISWHPGEEGQSAWQIAVDTIATINPDSIETLIDVNDSAYVLTGLDPETHYYVYVRANCGSEDGVSVWSNRLTFTTSVACPAPTGLKAELTPGNGSIATLTWNPAEASAWTVEYSVNADMSDSIVVAVEDSILALTGLTPETTYYARVKADCGEADGVSLYSAILSFTPTDSYLMTINDGTATNEYVPVYGYWTDNLTRSQFIIPEQTLEELEWDSIKALTFYSSSTNTNWDATSFEVYVAEAPETTMSALTDWNDMTLVMNAASLNIVNGQMVITFDEAYHYQGGNLLIGIKQIVSTTSSNAKHTYWYGVNANGASFGGYGDGNNVAQRNFLPKMMIEYVPGVGPACPNPKQLAVSNITADSATFSWKAVEGAAWEYAVALASAAEPTEFNAVPEGENSIAIGDLEDATAYVFYLRRNCGEDGNSEVISLPFETIEFAQLLSYSYDDDFETNNKWKLINGANAWVIGNATSNGGDQALYISNDGAAYAYDESTPSVSFATKLFNIERTGTFSISYDWKDAGDFSVEDDRPFDFLRVAFAPADVALSADVQPEGLTHALLPAGWIALDQDTALYGAETWQHITAEALIPNAGLYRLVFVWVNDDAFTDGVPAAIDNLSIIHKANMTDIEGGAGIENKAVKFMHNNQVYILLNGVIYNVTGQKVELR